MLNYISLKHLYEYEKSILSSESLIPDSQHQSYNDLYYELLGPTHVNAYKVTCNFIFQTEIIIER